MYFISFSLVPWPLPVFQCFSACNIEKLGVAWGRGKSLLSWNIYTSVVYSLGREETTSHILKYSCYVHVAVFSLCHLRGVLYPLIWPMCPPIIWNHNHCTPLSGRFSMIIDHQRMTKHIKLWYKYLVNSKMYPPIAKLWREHWHIALHCMYLPKW